VEFELSQYYLFGYWNLVETFTSNDQGEIVLDQEFCEQNISYNTLYRFEENILPARPMKSIMAKALSILLF